jgi:hypothetical protein
MCPACLTTLALLAAGSGTAGGVAAFLVRKVRPRPPEEEPTPAEPPVPPADEERA